MHSFYDLKLLFQTNFYSIFEIVQNHVQIVLLDALIASNSALLLKPIIGAINKKDWSKKVLNAIVFIFLIIYKNLLV